MVHQWGGIGEANRFRNGLIHIEFSVTWRRIRAWKTRSVLTFFDLSFFPFWDTNGVVSELQTAFESDSHTLRGDVGK
jgi:hypothetical protein